MLKQILLTGTLTLTLCQPALAAPKKKKAPKTEAAPAVVTEQPKEPAVESHATLHGEPQAPRKCTLLSFELSGNLGFGSGGGYSLGPDLGYTPQISLIPLITLTPRADVLLFKSSGGVAPLFRLGAEGWFNVHPSIYVAPGLGLGIASSGGTKAFPMLSATAGYKLKLASAGILSKLDRAIFRYDLWISSQTTHSLTLGAGANF